MNLVKKFITRNPCYQANVNKADSRYTTVRPVSNHHLIKPKKATDRMWLLIKGVKNSK